MRKRIACIGLCALFLCVLSASADEVRMIGDLVVVRGDSIQGDVVAVTGNLVISGYVSGSAIAYRGDVILDSTAVVGKDVVARSGKVRRAPGARVHGNVVQGRLPKVRVGKDNSEAEPQPHWLSWNDSELESDFGEPDNTWRLDSDTEIELSYDKVDGLYLGLAFDHLPLSDYGVMFHSFGSGGYAFASHTWQGRGGFGLGLPPRGDAEIALDMYHLTHTEDAWAMSNLENSLAAFFLHEDFRDYYQREGFGATLMLKPLKPLTLSTRYQVEQHETLENATNWALFGGDKCFLPNLFAQPGMWRGFVFGATLDTRDHSKHPRVGWRMEAQVELTEPDFASDFDYRRATLDLRRFQPLGSFVNFDQRLRFGNATGTLPPQKRFYLGGPSSLPGFGLKSLVGREFALWNAELRLHDDRQNRHGILGDLGFFVFSDLGIAADQAVSKIDLRDWAHDVGVGLSDDSGTFRVQVAKRTDTSEDPYVFMLRIARPF